MENTTTITESPASERQIAYINALAAERGIQFDTVGLGRRAASTAIDALLKTPKVIQPAPVAAAAPVRVAAPKGLHRVGDDIYKVYESRHILGRMLAKVLRIHGSHAEFVYVGQARTVAGLSADTLMTEAEARRFGRANSFCVNCCAALWDVRSVAAGYGPTCAKNNGWAYPGVREARRIVAEEMLTVPELVAAAEAGTLGTAVAAAAAPVRLFDTAESVF